MNDLTEDLYQIYQMPPTSILSNQFGAARKSVRQKFSPIRTNREQNTLDMKTRSLSIEKLLRGKGNVKFTNTINKEDLRQNRLPTINPTSSLSVQQLEILKKSSRSKYYFQRFRIFKNPLDRGDKFLQQTKIGLKAKSIAKNNKDKVDIFLNQYSRHLDRKEIQVLKKSLKDESKIVDIYYIEKQPQLPRLKQYVGSNNCVTSTYIRTIGGKRRTFGDNQSSESDIYKSLSRQDNGLSQRSSSSSSDLGLDESEASDSDNDSDMMAIDHDINLACNQVKQNLMPILDEDKQGQEQFYSYVKKSEKINDLQQYFQFQDDTLYSQMANVQLRKNLFPRLVGVKQGDFNSKKIHLNKKHIGDEYMEALCVSFNSAIYQDIKSINLQENQITAKGLKHLINHLPGGLKELNLQDNNLQYAGCALLKPICQDIYGKLKSLNLENNKIRDRGAIALLDGLKESAKIQDLNMSKNEITDIVSESVYNFLSVSKSIECFYMHWNFLKNNSANAIAKALQRNPIIKVLDLSNNAIGSQNDKQFINNWCKVIENPKTEITHLDLSYNKINIEELRLLSLALQQNHTIFGIHIEGNQNGCLVDSKGFLRFTEELDLQETFDDRPQKKSRIDDVNYLTQKSDFNLNYESFQMNNCCWICQGWQEVTFIWIPGKSGMLSTGPIFLHLDFENFTPIMMDDQLGQVSYKENKSSKSSSPVKKGKQQLLYEVNDQYLTFFEVKQQHLKEKYGEIPVTQFSLKKMCPPDRRILYFFSNPLEEVQISALDQSRIKVTDNFLELKGLDIDNTVFKFLDGTEVPAQDMDYYNYVDTKQSFVLDSKSDYAPIVEVFPRDKEKQYALAKKALLIRKRKVNIMNWSHEISFFKDYIEEDQILLDTCFEFDFNCSKISKFVKNDYEREKLKLSIRSYYHSIKDTFRYHSSVSLLQGYETFCFPYPDFIKLLQESGLIDNVWLKVNDVELDLISTKINVDPIIINNPSQGLNRFQLLEIIFRISLDKYIRTQICRSFSEAFVRIMKDGLEQRINDMEKIQDWRNQRFYTRGMDLVIKMKLGFLNQLFDYISEITNKKWLYKIRWVSVKEILTLLYKTDLITDFMREKDVHIIFNLSMMTQIHEVTEDKCQKMCFIEFVELLSRLAESLSPAPMGFNYESISLPKKQSQSLHVYNNTLKKIKFEVLLTYFYQKLPITEKDLFAEFFNLGDAKISMPTQKNIIKFTNSEYFEQTAEEKIKLEIIYPEQNSILEIGNVYKRLINPIKTLKYIEVFKEPHLHPQFLFLFYQEKPAILRKRRGGELKEKRQKQQQALKKITKGFTMRKVG